jgi:hypothetical protein
MRHQHAVAGAVSGIVCGPIMGNYMAMMFDPNSGAKC